MPASHLTVLIPTHGRPTLLKRTLESLKACELPVSYHELVVIENGSRDGAEKLVADLPERLNARYMHRERGNKSYALNEALETIDNGLVVFFDDDIRVEPKVLVSYAKAAEEHSPGCFFGGGVEIDYEQAPSSLLKPFYPQSAHGYEASLRQKIDFFLGFNWAAFSTDIKLLGGFNPQFGPGSPLNATGQETEMQARMKNKGLRPVNVRQAKVRHYFPSNCTNFSWLLYRYFRGGIRAGLLSHTPPVDFFLAVIWQTIQSVGLLGKGIVTLNPHKIVFFVLNTAERIGLIKGYVNSSSIK